MARMKFPWESMNKHNAADLLADPNGWALREAERLLTPWRRLLRRLPFSSGWYEAKCNEFLVKELRHEKSEAQIQKRLKEILGRVDGFRIHRVLKRDQ